MELFQKLFKKKINIQDVLASLENFSNDVKSLNNVVDVSSKFFGKNWKFNLEMYINSMPIEDNQKYLPLFFNVLNFEKALNLWISAQQVLKGAKSLSSSMLKDMPEYEEFLPKFGIEGVRLLEKFKDKDAVMVGGTGLYLKAALFDYKFLKEEKMDEGFLQDVSNEELYRKLLLIDKDDAIKMCYESIEHYGVKELLIKKFEIIDYEETKEDVISFIKNAESLTMWNRDFFISITEKLN